jgi:hypothetical protein
MHVPELSLKDRTELKRLMDRIGRAAADIKRAAHTFTIRDVSHKQMEEIVSFTTEAAAIMDSLKVKPLEEEKSTELDENQLVIDLDPIMDGTEVHS